MCDIQQWIIQKSLLTAELTDFKLNREQLTVLCCANATAPCFINSDEKD
jgi:hypothetical protein